MEKRIEIDVIAPRRFHPHQNLTQALIMRPKDLIETLNRARSKRMTVDFLNCGNRQLEEAAGQCAKKRCYSMPSTVDWEVPKWGQAL